MIWGVRLGEPEKVCKTNTPQRVSVGEISLLWYKHCSLLLYGMNYGRKKFYGTGPWSPFTKSFIPPTCKSNHVILDGGKKVTKSCLSMADTDGATTLNIMTHVIMTLTTMTLHIMALSTIWPSIMTLGLRELNNWLGRYTQQNTFYCFFNDECHYVVRHFSGCCYAEYHYAKICSVKCDFAECRYAECHNVEWLSDECRGPDINKH